MDFSGKVAVVTGSARGIGRTIAEQFHKAGAKIVISDLDQDAVDAVVSELGENAIGIKANVTNAEEVASLVDGTVERLGSLDIIVNNAGITRDTLMMRMDEKD